MVGIVGQSRMNLCQAQVRMLPLQLERTPSVGDIILNEMENLVPRSFDESLSGGIQYDVLVVGPRRRHRGGPSRKMVYLHHTIRPSPEPDAEKGTDGRLWVDVLPPQCLRRAGRRL